MYANDLTNGLYSYYLIVDGKVIATKKLIKQNTTDHFGGVGFASSILKNKIEKHKLEKYGNKNYVNYLKIKEIVGE